jgi:hypothetical protein
MSPKYTLTKDNIAPILKVIGWSVASAIVASLISIMSELDVPTEYAFLVPLVNSILYTIKEFVSDKK